MKKNIYFFVFALLSVVLGSCIGTWEDMKGLEYPSNIYFSKDGGCKIIYGLGGSNIRIKGINDEYYYPTIVGDTIINYNAGPSKLYLYEVGNDWASAKHWEHSDSIEITVTPNLTGKSRYVKLKLDGYKGETSKIFIRQEK